MLFESGACSRWLSMRCSWGSSWGVGVGAGVVRGGKDTDNEDTDNEVEDNGGVGRRNRCSGLSLL